MSLDWNSVFLTCFKIFYFCGLFDKILRVRKFDIYNYSQISAVNLYINWEKMIPNLWPFGCSLQRKSFMKSASAGFFLHCLHFHIRSVGTLSERTALTSTKKKEMKKYSFFVPTVASVLLLLSYFLYFLCWMDTCCCHLPEGPGTAGEPIMVTR